VTPEDSEVVVLREHDGINDEDNLILHSKTSCFGIKGGITFIA
jgi:hypothetical protein